MAHFHLVEYRLKGWYWGGMEATILVLVGVSIFAVYFAYHALAEKLNDLREDVNDLIRRAPDRD